MSNNPFAPEFTNLPETLSVFPLEGVLLLPHGSLPLNIFEARYVAMIEDAIAADRMIGMIQPKEGEDLYTTGCAGKITEFTETGDGRYLIKLTGICRFDIAEEIETDLAYRRVRTNWTPYQDDLDTKTCLGVDRDRLQNLLMAYFEKEGMSCDFDKFEDIQDGKLMTCLSMICPFEPSEKQALLEQVCCRERAQMFMTMIEMALISGKPLDKSKHQCH